MKLKFIVILLFFMFLPVMVNAQTYTPTNDLFENSYTNNLIDMAQTQIDNISNKYYAIVQIDYNYYFISSYKKDVSVSGNTINMEKTTIIRAIRNQSGYNTYYTYDTINESKTVVYANNIIISNIDTSKSVSSKRFSDYLNEKNVTFLLMFILGISFAIFVTKERSY